MYSSTIYRLAFQVLKFCMNDVPLCVSFYNDLSLLILMMPSYFLCLCPLKQLACHTIIFVSPFGLQAGSRGQRAHLYITISLGLLPAWVVSKLPNASAVPWAVFRGGTVIWLRLGPGSRGVTD